MASGSLTPSSILSMTTSFTRPMHLQALTSSRNTTNNGNAFCWLGVRVFCQVTKALCCSQSHFVRLLLVVPPCRISVFSWACSSLHISASKLDFPQPDSPITTTGMLASSRVEMLSILNILSIVTMYGLLRSVGAGGAGGVLATRAEMTFWHSSIVVFESDQSFTKFRCIVWKTKS